MAAPPLSTPFQPDVYQAGGETPRAEVAEFVDILKARLKEVERDSEWTTGCEELLIQINQSLNPSLTSGQELLDIAGGCDLLEVVVQYAGISEGCEAGVNTLIANIAGTCDPREMFTVFFEVINMYTKTRTLHLCIPLLNGLSTVFGRIRRRQAEFFKEAIPGLLEVGMTALEVKVDRVEDEVEDDISDSTEQHIPDYYLTVNLPSKLIDKLVNLGKVMGEVCSAEENRRLRDVVLLYILRLLVLVSCTNSTMEGVVPEPVEDTLKLLSSSNLCIKELLTTRQLEEILDRYSDEDEGQIHRTRFEARIGAALSVYWGIHNKDSPTAASVFDLLRSQIETSGRQGVSNIINMASILLVPLGWKQDLCFQHEGLLFITLVLELYGTMSRNVDAVQRDDAPVQIMPALKRIQYLVVHTSNPSMRREAYGLLIQTIRQALPAPGRYQALYDMIIDCDHPSLVSLLLTCVKDEIDSAWPRVSDPEIRREVFGRLTPASAETLVENTTLSPFVSSRVLQFIQCVLRARDGNLVELPSNIDAVVGALNVYRFLLIRESSGKTNYTHVLSYGELVKGRTYWLLPTREQALRVRSDLEEESDSNADILLGINCLLSVLYRCLELVEELLKDLPN